VSTTETERVVGGRYRVGRLLARGGMAEVYDGFDTRLGRPVAVKILRPAMAVRPEVRRRFEDEARAAARLSHPNVVAVFDTGEDEGEPWIVMECLSGETLAHKMAAADGPLPLDWTLRMAGDVLGALSAAHAAGIIHRDVKPGNILFSDEGCAKVGDFGIAKSVENMGDATTAGLLLGTPRYLAPERIEGRSSTAATDIYSMGVILYEALSGQPAFAGDTPVSTAYNVQHTPPPPLAQLRPDLPAPVVAAVERAMERDPAERFSTAAELGAALRDARPVVTDDTEMIDLRDPTVVLAPDPTAAAGGQAVGRLGPRVASRLSPRLIVVLVAAALIVLLLALLAAQSHSHSTNTAGSTASTTAAPSPVVTALRNAAARINYPWDGPAAPQVSAGLNGVADKLQSGQQAGADATALAAQVATLHQQHQLYDKATQAALAALGQVPGVDMTQATPSTAPPPPRHGKHKKGD
jgi:tRNA A-37 threonylcarbamoyl transferase component Bud32